MIATKHNVEFRCNGSPSSGYVEFDDGKSYFFFRDRLRGGYAFSGSRVVAGEFQSFQFKSPKREAALVAAVNAV